MKELLDRLQQTKRILVGFVLVVVGIALLIAGDSLADHGNRWLRLLPLGELGGISIGVGLVGIWIDRYFQREADEASEAQLRRLLKEHAPVMRDAVIEAFAADTEDLRRVANDQTLARLVQNGLALQLDDAEFASDIYKDISQQAIWATERWHDLGIDITLTPHADFDGYLVVSARWEYTVVPIHSDRRFICLSDRDEYSELIHTNGNVSPWFFKADTNFKADDPEAFELMAFSVAGKEQKIRRSTRNGYQQYAVNIPKDTIDAGEPVNISYTTRTVTQASGHLLFFDIEQPTHNIAVNLDYTDADLAAISAIDLIPSVRPTRIEHSPEGVPPKTVRVEIDGWTFPRSGVAFIWTLAREVAKS